MTKRFYEGLLKLEEGGRTSSYTSVNRWITKLNRRGSVATARLYFKALALFVKATGLSPDELVELPKQEALEKVQWFCDQTSSRGSKVGARKYMDALRSFLRANNFTKDDLDVLDGSYKAMKRPEYVPSKEEIYRMADVSGFKVKAIILALFQSGMRSSTIRALRIGDVREALEKGLVPLPIHVTGRLREVLPTACKEGVDYWTFLGAEAVEALRNYLNERRKRAPLSDEDLLFPPEARNLPKGKAGKPMSDWSLVRLVRLAARRAGIKDWETLRVHSFRKAFRSVLDAGYVDGGQMAEDDKEYLMGHTLPSQKAPYHTANVSVLAERYARLNWGRPSAISREQVRMEFVRMMLGRVSDTDLARLAKELGITPEQIRAMIRRLGAGAEAEAEEKATEALIKTERNGEKDPIKIVRGEEALIESLEEGWRFVKELSGDRYLLQKPRL